MVLGDPHESAVSCQRSRRPQVEKQCSKFTWEAVPGAAYYRVYKKKYGVFGYIGKAGAECSFDDENIGADTEDTPPEHKNPFAGPGDWPSQVFFHQQRLGWAATERRPMTIWLSRTGEFESMAASTPPKDDDAIEVTLAAAQANRIVWLQPDRQSLTFGSEGSEWTLAAGEGVALTPANSRQQAVLVAVGPPGVGAEGRRDPRDVLSHRHRQPGHGREQLSPPPGPRRL